MAESYESASRRFKRTLERIENGGTRVYEVVSYRIGRLPDLLAMLNCVSVNDVIWQHTPDYHVAAIRIAKGTGYDYSRSFFELINSGIDTPRKFANAWKKKNGSLGWGEVPTPKQNSFAQNQRSRQRSYIVADTAHEHPSRLIAGSLPNNQVDRTHLISFQAIGIENSPGLLIDFDAWLNRNPMNSFEAKALNLSNYQDIIWVVKVQPTAKGLSWKYLILDSQFKVLMKQRWIDDRWSYYWYADDYQRHIPNRKETSHA